jgi:hypothetical protein
MVTDKQVRDLFKFLLHDGTISRAARRTDMDEKTARKYRVLGQLPSEVAQPHTWATRPNPFAPVWDEVRELLEGNAGLQAKTIFGELQRRYPGRFADSQLRTLQRHIKRWRAQAGPPKEVFFTQEHEPGRLGASDFTSMNELRVTIQQQRFDHLVYHFVLTYSNWEAVTICFSESFESLSEGLQNALWKLGAVPLRHRTDRMSLAVNNASDQKEFRQRYQGLLDYYRLAGEKIQAEQAHENGDVEQRHRRFKEAVEQALLLRGSRDFANREEYEKFLLRLVEQLNTNRRGRLAEELARMQALPQRRLEACKRLRAKVDTSSLIHVERNGYSVPSRLIGEQVEVRLYVEHLEVWYAQQLVERLPRLRGRDKHHVNYRHIIDWLVRKPGAFALYRYRADLFPSSYFRMAYDVLRAQSEASAAKEYLKILHLAARQSEAQVETALRVLLTREADAGGISAALVEALLHAESAPMPVTEVAIEAVDLSCFDVLFTDKEVPDERESGSGEGTPGGAPEGIASADGAFELRGVGSASGGGDAQLRAVPAEPVRPGVPGALPPQDRAAAAAIVPAAGEELRHVRSETPADEGGAASAEFAHGGLCGAPGELARLRQAGLGEDASFMRAGPGSGSSRPTGVLHDLQPAGPGIAGGEARPEAEPRAKAVGRFRGDLDRRFGLRAAEPRGDGSVVHALGGSLRAWQRLADQQSAVLQVGDDLQRSHDHGGGDRPLGASQRDRGVEPAKLPAGTRQKSEGRGDECVAEAHITARGGRAPRELAVGPGFAPRDFATLVPLRSARPHRCGTELRVMLIVVMRTFARDF